MDFLSEMEADSSDGKVFEDLDQNDMDSVSNLAQQQVELELEIAEMEKAVKEKKKDLYILSTDILPSRMEKLGISGFEMDTGESLSIVKVVTASITEAKKEEAHKWLVEKGHGDIIKHTVTTKFSRGEEQEAKNLVTQLEYANLNYSVKQAVHAQTLKAFVKEQLIKGNEVDMDLLGVYEYNQCKITTPKLKKTRR
jgi:hypothetical protein